MTQQKTWYEKLWGSSEKFINFFNGKKNKIGNAALALYGVMETAVQLGYIPDHTVLGQAVLFTGITFKILGLSHKAVKGELQLPAGIRNSQQSSVHSQQ